MSSPVALFSGYDASGNSGLWVTDGTAAGTRKISDAAPNAIVQLGSEVLVFSGGLWVTDGSAAGTSELSVAGGTVYINPSAVTAFGSEVLFDRYASFGGGPNGNLWVTDGTAAGTSELSVATPYLNPTVLTVLGSEVLFAGTDASSRNNLWVTNGTAAGTSELSVAGASANGLFGSSLPLITAFGSEALFAGYDASGNYNLWVTDGTSGGTSELSVASAWAFGLNPHDITVFGSEAPFGGVDAADSGGLWITNGTIAGTSELFPGVFPQDLTVFGSEVLFSSGNALWISDGTAVGTSELSVTNAYTGANGFAPFGLTVFGSKVLFEGTDASGHSNLWVTDGSASGTSKLSVAGAYSLGLFNGPLPEIQVLGSEVLFNGRDASGRYNLWATDGTSGGTSEIAGNNSRLGIDPQGLTVVTNLTPVPPPPVPSAARSTIVVSPSTIKNDGTSAATLTVTVEDALGNVIPGTAVTLSANGTGNTFRAITGTTDANGIFTTTVTSTVPQAETITATEGSAQEHAFLNVVTGLESVTAAPASGTETPGQTVTFTLAMSGPVTVVGGTPALILNDGGSAYYDAAATTALHDPTKLVFDYSVGANPHEHNVSALTVQAINGGHILDQNGTDADFAGIVTAFPNLHVVVAPPATVTSVAASPSSGIEGVGATVAITVGLSKAVTVAGGTPTLTLNDGGQAVYNAAATAALGDPTKLVFSYTVTASEHNVGELTVQDGSLNGATVVDAGGNTPDFSGLTTVFPNLRVVAASPATVTSVVASPSSGMEGIGATVTITVGLSKAVTVAGGTPTLTLNDGGQAFYDAAATAALGDPSKLVFSYTVTASEHNVGALTVQDGSLNGAAVYDAAGNTPDFSGLTTAFPNLEVVTTAPATVTSVVASPTSGVEGIGAIITFTVSLSKAVTVAGGTPTLTLNDGGQAFYDATATAALGNPTKLVFSYTVTASEHNVSELTVQDGSLNGAAVFDAGGNTPDFSGLTTALPNLHVVVPATVTSVVASPSSGTMSDGQTVTFTLTMSKAVAVAGGSPFLALSDAGKAIYDAVATAALGDPTKLVFSYTVAQTDTIVPSLSIIGGSYNGAAVTDASGTVPDFSASLVGFPGLVADPTLHTTPAPVLTSIVAAPASGELVTGNQETITLNFDRPLFFDRSGSPQLLVFPGGPSNQPVNDPPELLLNDGAVAVYDAAHSTSTALAFDFTVGVGDLTTDLKISGLESTVLASLTSMTAINRPVALSGAGTDLGLQVNTASTGPAGPSTGPVNIANAQLALFGPSNAAVTLAPGFDVLILENSQSFAGTVAGFLPGLSFLPDGTAIDFADINFSGSTLSYAPKADNTGGMMTLSDGTRTANIALLGNYSAASFVKALDNSGHTLVENHQTTTI